MTEQTPKVKGFLAGVVAEKRAEVAHRRRTRPLSGLIAAAKDRPAVRSLARVLGAEGCGVIAEVKRTSPTAGALAPALVARERALLYEERGAVAVSVLTDRRFDGRLEDLIEVTGALHVPVLRKDFLVDPWQVWESRAAGADVALLLVAAVEPVELAELAAATAEAGLEAIVEIHRRDEAEGALAAGASIVGVNARDLSTLAVDRAAALATLAELRAGARDLALIAESGIDGPEAVRAARRAGADGVLVGEHLMRARDPGTALERLVAAGRSAR